MGTMGAMGSGHVGDLDFSPVVERPWHPLRVFVSLTSELMDHPPERSFLAAAEDALKRAGHAFNHMGLFGAADRRPADFCRSRVMRCDVYVGLIGRCYGTVVPDRPDASYTELEFETATAAGLRRLIFLIRDDFAPRRREPRGHGARQQAFRTRLRQSGLLVVTVASPASLEVELYQSLVDLDSGPGSR